MYAEINVLKRTVGSLAVGAALLFGMGLTTPMLAGYPTYYVGQKGVKQEKHAVKKELKFERRGRKTYPREDRDGAHKRCVKECNQAHKRGATRLPGEDKR